MDINQQKATAFVRRLLQNPALGNLASLQKEEQIINFLKINANQLLPTLSSANFFPNQPWSQIFGLLYQSLLTLINESLFAQLKDILDRIDFTFISFLRQQNFPLVQCRNQLEQYIHQLLQKFEARRAFIGPCMALQYNYTDRYVDLFYESKQYIHFELTKVQRLKMSKKEIQNMIKASLVLKIAVYHLTMKDPNESLANSNGLVQHSYAEKVLEALKGELKLLPVELLKSAVDSNLSFAENSKLEATSRITAILASRCQNYQVITKLDRGAETPDKSWFSIARRNYRYYGFDLKMIEEFYRIAAENGW